MKEFDYENNKIVGYVDFFANSNAKLEVLGYTDWENEFHELSEKEINEMFPPRGKIFAHNFATRFYNTKGSVVCLSVIPNEKSGDNLDAYVWNKSEEVYEYGTKAKELKESFTANGQHNYTILERNNLLNVGNDTFVFSYGCIYLIKANSTERLISYWKTSSFKTIISHDKMFVIESPKSKEEGKIDITTDEQLLDWYMKNVLKNKWGEIFEQKTFRNVEPIIRNAITVSKGLDKIIVESRIKRLEHINKSLILSYEELKDLRNVNWLKESIEESISRHKTFLLEEIGKEKAKELQEIRERYEIEVLTEKEHAEIEIERLRNLVSEEEMSFKVKQDEHEEYIRNKKAQSDLIDKELQTKKEAISALEESIGRLEKKKDDIVEDFAVVKDVLGLSRCATENAHHTSSYTLEEIELSEINSPIYQVFIKAIENTLKANDIPHSEAENIGKQMAYYNILLVPDVAIAKVIVMSSMRCRYLVEYVNATWKSFSDLWDNGLGYMVDVANTNADMMYFLILQNINLTYLPNYMMPLIDLQRGLISVFPVTNKCFPNNLRIICTITKDEVMPLNEECLKYVGCVDKSVSKDFYGMLRSVSETNIGYLTPQILMAERLQVISVPNHYKDYLSDD